MNSRNLLVRLIAALLLTAVPVCADVKMPSIFGDHMVLQQDATLPLWGTAEPGEKVTVTIGTATGSATATADGKWTIKLAPLPTGKDPVTVTVAGKNTITFQDVLIGDVWVCSGQSNMSFGLVQSHTGATDIPLANDPQLRFYSVPLKVALQPETEANGRWEVCTPEKAKNFSAVAYYFGRDLRSHLNRPIGLISTNWGGTPAQAWTSIEGLKSDPALQHFVGDYDRIHKDYSPEAVAKFETAQAAYKTDRAKWDQEVGNAFKPVLAAWDAEVAKAKAAGQPLPPKPAPPTPAPVMPSDPTGASWGPANLFNAMISPIIPYAIKGAIWYQGEANTYLPVEYRNLFAAMITDWRQHWGQGDFPFLFVQLARFKAPDTNWAELQYSQFKTSVTVPKTGIAAAYDVGDNTNIHPADKFDVGQRLALAARHVAYGENLVYSGPVLDKIAVEGNKVRVSFTETGGGLIIGTAPWTPPGATPVPNTSLVGFTVAGADGKWSPADAVIDGSSVVLSSAQVPQPVSVRYAFESSFGNLYNKEGLPAFPFRTDPGIEGH